MFYPAESALRDVSSKVGFTVADSKRPLKPEDLLRFQVINDPKVSPDGKSAVYGVAIPDLKKGRTRSSLWLAPLDGGSPRQISNPGEGSDRMPAWSPGGERIAFLSDRSGKPQIWVLPAEGGEAAKLETKERPTGFAWSPDGRQIAFTAVAFTKAEDWTPYPGAPEDDRERAVEVAGYDPDAEKKGPEPSGVKVISRLSFRMDGIGYYGDKRNQIFVMPADGSGPARRVSEGDLDYLDPAWSPDGWSIFCGRQRQDDPDVFNRADICRIDLETGATEVICENPGPAYRFQVSPDARNLLFGGHDGRHGGYSTSAQLWVLPLDRTGAEPVSITGPLDRPIGPSAPSDLRVLERFHGGQWSSDSQGVYFLLADRGESHLHYAPADGSGEPQRLTGGEHRSVYDFSVGRTGRMVAAIGDGSHPAELFLLETQGERRLTDQNGELLAEVEVVAPERFTYKGADGWPMDGWLIRPVGYEPGRKYPTVLTVHGGPHSEYGPGMQVLFQTLASAGFAVVCTNPRGSQTYGQEFALAVLQDWGGKDYADIMAGLDAVIAMGVANPDRMGVMGWSYGGFMTCWTVTQTERFKAAITGAPVANRLSFIGTSDIPWFMEWQGGGNPWTREGEEKLLERSPIRFVANVTTPTMVMCGEGDLRCPIEQADQFYMALRRLGKAPTVLVRYPGEYHGFGKPSHRVDRYKRTVAWFKHYILG